MNLVTGSTGLIGSHLILDLLKKGERVRAMRRETSDLTMVEKIFDFYECRELLPKIEWLEGDVLDIPSLEEAIEGVKIVYHCAAIVSFHPADFDLLFKVNVEGTANVVNVCLENEIQHLCFVSSIAALGRTSNGETITERSNWKQSPFNTNYAISKNAAEHEVWRGMEEGLKAVIVNPGLVIGPGDKERSSGILLGKVKDGLKFYPPGLNGFVDVRDVTKAMITLVEHEVSNQRFILVAENLKFKDFLDNVARAFNVEVPKIKARTWMLQMAWRSAWLWERITGKKAVITKESVLSSPFDFYYDHSKVKAETGINFIPVKKSIKNAVDFIKSYY